MKKKLVSLQHWLNRLTLAYSKNELTSAMAEADSLSAELEGVRDELWDRVEEETLGRNWKKFFLAAASRMSLVLVISLFIVCISICPITQDFTNIKSKTSALSVAVSAKFDKKKQAHAIASPSKSSKSAKKVSSVAVAQSNFKQTSSTGKQARITKSKEEPKTSEVLATLVQVGEKSLHGDKGSKFIIKKDKKLQSKELSL